MLGNIILIFTFAMTMFALIDWINEDDEFEDVK